MGARDEVRRALGSLLDVAPDRVALFWKGRVALHALLRAMGIGAGDEVIVPAFTCVVVPSAILYAGATPVYADIDPRTYTLDPAAVGARISPRTRAILAQNTFGLPADLDALADLAEPGGIVVLDDACHGLGGAHRGAALSERVAGAFYSAQWSKPVSAGLGGIAVARDADVARALRRIEATAPVPSAGSAITLELLRRGREVAEGRIGFGRLRDTYHALTRLGLGPPSSEDAELTAPTMPPRYLRRMAPMQARALLRALGRLPTDTAHRRAVARRYDAALAELGLPVPFVPEYAEHGYLRYPLVTLDRTAFLSAARRAGVEVGDWFVSPLHPLTERLERWGYEAGRCPVGDRVAATIVNLPTGPETGPREVDRVVTFVRDHAVLVAPSTTARIGPATARSGRPR